MSIFGIFCGICKYLVVWNVRTCLYFSNNIKLKLENMHSNYLQMVIEFEYSKKKIFSISSLYVIFSDCFDILVVFFPNRYIRRYWFIFLFEFQKSVKVGSYSFFSFFKCSDLEAAKNFEVLKFETWSCGINCKCLFSNFEHFELCNYILCFAICTFGANEFAFCWNIQM